MSNNLKAYIMKTNLIVSLIVVTFLFSVAIVVEAQDSATTKKEVPEEYKNKVNPIKGDESLKMVGLRNFNRHCVSCHGKKGVGDGVMSKSMKLNPGDLTTAEFQEYTDGEIYYLSFVGIDNRPDFMKLIPDEEEKWAIVNYVRSLKAE